MTFAMARSEPSIINHCVPSSITSRASSLTKDSIQRNDDIKTELTLREGTYKISSLIDNLGKLGTITCLNEAVKLTLLSRIRTVLKSTSRTSSRRSSATNHPSSDNTLALNGNESNGMIGLIDILIFNIGRELIVYELNEGTQLNFDEPLDHRIYKQNHLPTCHDIIQHSHTNTLHILVGFSKGQIQYINMQSKEQKVFNEGSYLDKSKVTCVKWLSNPPTYFMASYSSGCLYVFDEQLNYQRDPTMQPVYSTIQDNEKNYSISYAKNKTKQIRNPVARWSIGSGSINEFAFSPDQILLAIVSQDGFLRIFNYEKMELVAYMKSYFGGLLCVCWSPDGKYIATGGEDDFLTLFSLDSDEHTPRVICRGHGHTSWISAISFDPYMNAKNYYSLSPFKPESEGMSQTPSESPSFDTTIPSLFYRIASVGQDNRLCLWDITEDVLKLNSKQYPLISSPSTSNGYVSLTSDLTNHTQNSTTKSSFSSLTSRLSFVRHSNKVTKSTDDTVDLALVTLSNGSRKKSRIKSSSSKLTNSDDSNQSSLSTLTTSSLSSSRRTNFDLTKTTFGTNLCPKLEDIQVIEPIITEFISHERLNGIAFSENYFLTSSQDGLIAIWEKPAKLIHTNLIDDQSNSNSQRL